MRERKKFALNEQNGFWSCTMVNMGITAHRLNKNLKFDSKNLKFDHQEANALIHQPMRTPWQIQESNCSLPIKIATKGTKFTNGQKSYTLILCICASCGQYSAVSKCVPSLPARRRCKLPTVTTIPSPSHTINHHLVNHTIS